MLERDELTGGTDDDDDAGTDDAPLPEQTAPLIVGVSAAPPFLFTWNPKLTL